MFTLSYMFTLVWHPIGIHPIIPSHLIVLFYVRCCKYIALIAAPSCDQAFRATCHDFAHITCSSLWFGCCSVIICGHTYVWVVVLIQPGNAAL